jgi:hypothetical protein
MFGWNNDPHERHLIGLAKAASGQPQTPTPVTTTDVPAMYELARKIVNCMHFQVLRAATDDVFLNKYHHNQAVIGGGFARDILMGNTPNDLDVYVPTSYIADSGIRPAHEILLNHLKTQWNISVGDINVTYDDFTGIDKNDPYLSYMHQQTVKRIVHFTANGIPAQLIFVDVTDPAEYVKYYTDCSLSEAWLTHHGDIHCTQRFSDSRLKKQIVFKETVLPEYKQKIVDRFPEYSHVMYNDVCPF